MVCLGRKMYWVVPTAVIGGLILLALPTAIVLRHLERKQKRRRDGLNEFNPSLMETKTVVVENRGPVNGIPGTAEVVTTGPTGTSVTAVPTSASGTAIVSTASAGVPGNVSVDLGKAVTVTAEHPTGRPDQANITKTVQS